MMLSLQDAADLAGVNKSTLFRAIKSGKISASRDEHNQWRLDPAELSRVYPIAVGDAPQQRAMPRKRDRTDELVAQLREQLADMRGEVERARNDADHARNDAETWRTAFEQAQRLLPTPSHPTQPPLQQQKDASTGVNSEPPSRLSRYRAAWRWLRSTG